MRWQLWPSWIYLPFLFDFVLRCWSFNLGPGYTRQINALPLSYTPSEYFPVTNRKQSFPHFSRMCISCFVSINFYYHVSVLLSCNCCKEVGFIVPASHMSRASFSPITPPPDFPLMPTSPPENNLPNTRVTLFRRPCWFCHSPSHLLLCVFFVAMGLSHWTPCHLCALDKSRVE